MKLSYEWKPKFRDLFPGPEYAKEWERERYLEVCLEERFDQQERSKVFWAWLREQTRDLTSNARLS